MEPKTAAPAPQAPVMDVTPPDPVAPPPPETQTPQNNPEAPVPDTQKAAAPVKPPAPASVPNQAPKNSSVTAAIIGTVVIVLGLSVLAVMAYLNSK